MRVVVSQYKFCQQRRLIRYWNRTESDNVHSHTAIHVPNFLAQHPTYSTDLALANFFLFSCLKGILKEIHRAYVRVPAIQQHATLTFRRIPNETFAYSLKQLYGRWRKCITAHTEIFRVIKGYLCVFSFFFIFFFVCYHFTIFFFTLCLSCCKPVKYKDKDFN